MSKTKGQIIGANRMRSADAAMKGMQASLNPRDPKPLGATPGAPAKNPPKAHVAPNVKGSTSKNPMPKVKLGNHF